MIDSKEDIWPCGTDQLKFLTLEMECRIYKDVRHYPNHFTLLWNILTLAWIKLEMMEFAAKTKTVLF